MHEVDILMIKNNANRRQGDLVLNYQKEEIKNSSIIYVSKEILTYALLCPDEERIQIVNVTRTSRDWIFVPKSAINTLSDLIK